VTFVGASAGPGDAFPTAIPGVIAVRGSEHFPESATVTAPSDHIMTLRPEAQYAFESGTSVAAAEVTGVIALLISASDGHLNTGTIVSLLKETWGTNASAVPPTINVSAALEQLEADEHRGRYASGANAR
jgi:subtilisin family serine protease